MTPVSGDTSLATIQSQPLRASLALAFAIDVLGLGGKADDEPRPPGLALRDGREDVGVLDQRERRRAAVLSS